MGILAFELPEDKEAFLYASHAVSLVCALDEIANHMRTITKYGLTEDMIKIVKDAKNKDEAVSAILWHVREKLWELRDEATNSKL
jgi:hypothetical protein